MFDIGQRRHLAVVVFCAWRLGIATTRRVRGLGVKQRAALVAEFDGRS